jgi:DNA processing protein
MSEATSARDRMIALSLLPFLSPNRTRLFREYFPSISAACDASASLLSGVLSLTPDQAMQVRNALTTALPDVVASLRDSVVVLGDETYPPLLLEIPDPPLVLHVRGDVSLLSRPGIAIVGSRRATAYAVNAAQHLTGQLASAGLVIVSGMARGVDTAAHCAALDAGAGTIAVLGTGIDLTYPAANRRLCERIAANGLVVSEFPPGTPPRRENFPVRNRLISGLTIGTVIVEASNRSGSLITARMAAEQNREVFAVPGSIFSAGSEGTHRLIQYGAKLVHDANDVLDELPGEFRVTAAPGREEPAGVAADVLAALSPEDERHIDDVTLRTGHSPSAIAEALLALELDERIRALPGARYVRRI